MTETILLSARLQDRLAITSEQLAEFCERWQIAELAFFGSILRDDFNVESDIDVLVTYKPSAKRGLFEKLNLKDELSLLFHREVDVVSKKAIETSYNWLRRKNILSSAEIIYVA
jgi:uncharacterized protein